MSLKKLFNSKAAFPLVIICLVFLLCVLILNEYLEFWQYMIGYSGCTGYYPGAILWYIFIATALLVGFLCIYILVVSIACYKHGCINLFQSAFCIVLVFLFLFFTRPSFGVLRHVYVTNGFLDMVEEKADIKGIRDWLEDFQYTEQVQQNMRSVKEWPSVIQELNPELVLIEKVNSKKLVRLVYGGGLLGSFGLAVMEEPVAVPFDEFYVHEYRIHISPNAYVWHQLKWKPKFMMESEGEEQNLMESVSGLE